MSAAPPRTSPPAPRPADEAARLAAVRASGALAVPRGEAMDDFTRLASQVCGAPVSLLSICDAEALCFKSTRGLALEEAPRDSAFCAWALLGEGVLEVPDTHADPRFCDNPLVADPAGLRVRFYAGVPVRGPGGAALGTLCVMAQEPRRLTAEQRAALEALARQVSAHLELVAQRTRLEDANRHLEDARRHQEDAHRRLAEREGELREAGAQVSALLEDATDLVLMLDARGHVLYVNPAWERLTGLAASDVAGRPLAERVPMHARLGFEALRARLAQGERATSFDLVLTHADGSELVLEGNASARRTSGAGAGADGAPTVRAILRDVTAQRRTQRALARVSTLQRAILDSASAFILTTDVHGTLQTVNAAAARLFGYPPAELEGRVPLVHLGVPTQLSAAAAQDFFRLAGRARAGEADTQEWRCVRRDGSRFRARVSLSALVNDAGTLTGFVLLGEDLTGREEVDRLKDQFVSIVSHELRTPLTSIRGALGLLAGGVLGELPPEALEVLGIARDNSERLVRLINDILDLEKVRAGALELGLRDLEAGEVVRAALHATHGMAQAAGVHLEAEPSPALRLRGDPDRLVQVLTNLLSNAVKFSPRGQAVRVRVGPGPQGGAVRFSVTDAGPGIPADALPRLFLPFSQLDASDVRSKGGTGLGLAIARAIAEQHGGRTGVDTWPGAGSTFWFEVPTPPGPAAAAPWNATPVPLDVGGPGAAGAAARRRVLVVEDDAGVRRLLARLLAAAGWEVDAAQDGAEGLVHATTRRPDLVVLDVGLPAPDGFDVVDLLRHAGLGAVPLVVYTGRDLSAQERARLVLGPTRHLVKTRVPEAALVDVARELLDV